MGLRQLTTIKRTYDSGFDDILNEFYIPTLSEATVYKRIAGFFSSSSLSIAARGISAFIRNGGTMQLIVSPRLSAEDITMMEAATQDPESVIETVLLKEIEEIDTLLKKKRIEALGWLIATKRLEIRVATVYDSDGRLMDWEQVDESGLFHIKVGILEDEYGDIITFSGSVNETASAWKKNIEEFKVFKSWEPDQLDYLNEDRAKFENYWNGRSERIHIDNLPEAVNKKILSFSPPSFEEKELEILKNAEEEKGEEIQNQNRLSFTPFEYQREAAEVWQREKRAIFEMATGTGKTKTAEVCIYNVLREDKPVVFFIVCPQDTLAKQWLGDIQESGMDCSGYVIADSTNSKWRDELEFGLLNVSVERPGRKKSLFVFTTFDTYYGKDFRRIIRENKGNTLFFIIGDEVHGLGSGKRREGLIEEYDYRLGLSATPDRWFDDEGTRILTEYFSDNRYEFSLERAINDINPATGKTYLTPYDYIPMFVPLTDEEIAEYNRLTKQIVKLLGKSKTDEEAADRIERLRFIRADIHKSAENKMVLFKQLVQELKDNMSNTIIFAAPGQIEDVMQVLRENSIIAHRFTESEGNKPEKRFGGKSEREHIIKCFKDQTYQTLVAIKCLDEGIDIPSAERAIILASSTNPREYIQRIGRIIRRSKGKEKAIIYDLIIEPTIEGLEPELAEQEKKIFEKEMVRIREISENADNRLKVIRTVYDRI